MEENAKNAASHYERAVELAKLTTIDINNNDIKSSSFDASKNTNKNSCNYEPIEESELHRLRTQRQSELGTLKVLCRLIL